MAMLLATGSAPVLRAARAAAPTMDLATFNKMATNNNEKVAAVLDSEFNGAGWEGSTEIKDKAGLIALAEKLNPSVGYYDPLNIMEDAAPESIAWFRHAEIKHGYHRCDSNRGLYPPALAILFPPEFACMRQPRRDGWLRGLLRAVEWRPLPSRRRTR